MVTTEEVSIMVITSPSAVLGGELWYSKQTIVSPQCNQTFIVEDIKKKCTPRAGPSRAPPAMRGPVTLIHIITSAVWGVILGMISQMLGSVVFSALEPECQFHNVHEVVPRDPMCCCKCLFSSRSNLLLCRSQSSTMPESTSLLYLVSHPL